MKNLLLKSFILITCLAATFSALAQEKDTTRYRLLISFTSIASGIDTKARKQVDSLIAVYEEAKGITLEKEVVNWGREGERDYCMQLRGLNKKEKKNFIKQVKTIAKNGNYVFVGERVPCPHKPQRKMNNE